MVDACEGLGLEGRNGDLGVFDMCYGLDLGEIGDEPDADAGIGPESCWSPLSECPGVLAEPVSEGDLDPCEHGGPLDCPTLEELRAEAPDTAAGGYGYLDDPFDGRLEIAENVEQFEKAMDGINPGYDPFCDGPRSTNCGACAVALEARFSGADPEATAGATNIGTVGEIERITGMLQASASPEEIEDHARFMGPGYHAIVGFDRAESQDGHWFNVAVADDGRAYALDPQCGIALPFGEYIRTYASDGVNFDISLSHGEALHARTE